MKKTHRQKAFAAVCREVESEHALPPGVMGEILEGAFQDLWDEDDETIKFVKERYFGGERPSAAAFFALLTQERVRTGLEPN